MAKSRPSVCDLDVAVFAACVDLNSAIAEADRVNKMQSSQEAIAGACDRFDAACESLAATLAKTTAGIRAKAEAMRLAFLFDAGGEIEGLEVVARLALSVADDLKRLH